MKSLVLWHSPQKMFLTRRPRITAQEGENGLYHVSADFIFGLREKEFFVLHMWRMADFLSIGVLDYTMMRNHYHQLLAVPGMVEVSDEELLGRVQAYYGKNNREAMVPEKAFTLGGTAAGIQRDKYLRRMGNLSEYQKHLKQGFTFLTRRAGWTWADGENRGSKRLRKHGKIALCAKMEERALGYHLDHLPKVPVIGGLYLLGSCR